MRRWNGWGDETVDFPLPHSASTFLEEKLGHSMSPKDVSLQDSVARVPESRLPDHPLVVKDAAQRLCHSAGQSLADWIALRSGTLANFPDGVAYPVTNDDVRELLRYAMDTGVQVIPYGGGTSVVGHLSVPGGERPTLSVDMSRMNGLIYLDRNSNLATFQAGVRGPDLEASLWAAGLTLGHYPQSFEYSTLGGWVATRSAGQLSLGYGRIERLFTGGKAETLSGTLDVPVFPASAAGPDLRELILGSEGRLGIITEATVRVTSLPEVETFHAAFFPDSELGITAVRELARSSLPLAMLRLSLTEETITNLTLAGHSKAIELLNSLLGLRGVKDDKCMLLYGAVGSRKFVRWVLRQAREIIKEYKGVTVGARPGREWYKNRFRAPYLRNTLWERGYAVDTLETATTWAKVPITISAIEKALRKVLQQTGEKVFVFTHLSHVYPHGSSIYTTYLYRIAKDPAETLRRWQLLKKAASEAIVRCGGTISHQHGVGTDHQPYLGEEKGHLGLELLRNQFSRLDPDGLMNPGKLIQ